MRYDAAALNELLPAIYRLRDGELDPTDQPLRELIEVLSDQAVVLEDDLLQLYADTFIETCAPWVVPYIGDLIGLKGIQGPRQHGTPPRAEVANTIGYRRRKGTAAMLEQLAFDVTGWRARAVEFFEILCTTQYMNHLRPANRSFLDVRDQRHLEFLGSAFEHLPPAADLPHTADIRRIGSGRGRYNIPNLGIFVWRVRDYPLTRALGVRAPDGIAEHFRLDPRGTDVALVRRPETEDDPSSLASPYNVPLPISRRALAADVARDYGPDASIFLERASAAVTTKPVVIDATKIVVADLSEWTYVPQAGHVALDPMLGRVAFHTGEAPTRLLGSFHYGFSADLGGGEYDRTRTIAVDLAPILPVAGVFVEPPTGGVPGPPATIGPAIANLPPTGGVVEIDDSGTYRGAISIHADDEARIELQASDKCRPLLDLGGKELRITGDPGAEVSLNGLVIAGGVVRIVAEVTHPGIGRLRISHCTIVPGAGPTLIVAPDHVEVIIERCILGQVRVDQDARVSVTDSILDATSLTADAYTGTGAGEPGGQLTIEGSTVRGRVSTSALELASNCIFLSVVKALRRQEGCVRYSHVPAGSQVPRQFACQPDKGSDAALAILTSTAYGDPAYMQLSAFSSDAVRRGADDEGEMGAYHHLLQPLREAYLRGRLEDYLRFGLEAGVILAS